VSREAFVENLLLTPAPSGDAEPIAVGSPAWFAWLSGATRFRLATPQGLVTVRKERAGGGRGSWYWRAYRKRHGRLHRFYLGPDAALTPEALTAACAALGTLQTVPQEHGPPALVPNAEANGSEADGIAPILRTRITPPVLRAGLVARPALVTRLRAAAAATVTLLVAPAGFGKTTLLAQSFASTPEVAWLTLERSDDTPSDFLVALCAALAPIRPAVVSRASVLLHLPAPASAMRVLDLLLRELSDCAEACTIVLDDYHVLEHDPVHQLVARLVEHAPPALHVVIASRTEPPLPLARLRARGLLVELCDRELRFEPADAAKLLRSASGKALSDADVVTLTARTEGWAAGLQLAALALSTAADPARVIAAFSGEHRLVADYLLSEVLAELPPRLRRFLRATAILDRLSAPLCAAVWDDDGHMTRAEAQQLLEVLEQRGLFLTPLDDTRCWYRYHGLFAELVRAELARVEPPETIAALHLRAAAWYMAQIPTEGGAALEAAIGHSLAGGAPARAAELVERAGLQAVFTGEAETLQRWLRALPPGAVQARPFLRLAAAGHFPQLRHPQLVAEELASTHAPARGGGDDATTDPLHAAVARVELLGVRAFVAQACGELEQAATLLLEALALLPATEHGLRWRLLVSLGNAYALEGWLVAAHVVLSASLDAAGDDPVLSYLSQSYRAWVVLSMGLVEPARRTFAELCGRAEAAGWGDLPLMGEALLGLGATLAERGQLREGLALLERGLALMRRMGFNALLIPGELERARVCRALGQVAEAQTALASATEVARDFAAPFLQGRIRAARLDLGLDAVGELPSTSTVARYAEVPGRLAWARAAIRSGRAREALTVLAPLLPIAERRRWGWALLTARVLWARGCAAEQGVGTHEAVGEFVAQIASEGGLLPLLEEWPEAIALIQAVAAPAPDRSGLLGGYGAVQLAVKAQAATGVQAPTQGDDGRVADGNQEPLTPREQEVLSLIASGASNAEIAAQLVVTVGTVKAHSRSLFAKLGVANRTQAARIYYLTRGTTANEEEEPPE
jgi:LuxR family transcriptional regulator, maltose regulon positive regulatory protein